MKAEENDKFQPRDLVKLLASLERNANKKLIGFYSQISPTLPSGEIARLTEQDIPADYIGLYMTNTANNDTFGFIPYDPVTGYYEAVSIYWGFDNICNNQLIVANPWPYLVPIANARDIFFRCDGKINPAVTVNLSWTLYKYVDGSKYEYR